jgi:hypothetical protein
VIIIKDLSLPNNCPAWLVYRQVKQLRYTKDYWKLIRNPLALRW